MAGRERAFLVLRAGIPSQEQSISTKSTEAEGGHNRMVTLEISPGTPHPLPRKGLELRNRLMSSPPLVVPKAPSCRHCVMLMRGRLIGWVSSNCLKRPVQGEPSPKPLLPPSPDRLHSEPVLSPGMPWWEVLVPTFQESAWPSRRAHAHHLPSF